LEQHPTTVEGNPPAIRMVADRPLQPAVDTGNSPVVGTLDSLVVDTMSCQSILEDSLPPKPSTKDPTSVCLHSRKLPSELPYWDHTLTFELPNLDHTLPSELPNFAALPSSVPFRGYPDSATARTSQEASAHIVPVTDQTEEVSAYM
jgi:hypothetical protein